MNLDIEAMKAAALAATQGSWRWNRDLGALVVDGHDLVMWPSNAICYSPRDDAQLIGASGASTEPLSTQNMAHIETANPTAVLALIERLERIERNRDMWRGQCERQAEALTKQAIAAKAG